jgi:hypothetical protein
MKGCGGKYNKDIYECTTLDELRAFWSTHSAEKWNKVTIAAFVLRLRALAPKVLKWHILAPVGYSQDRDIAAWART